MIDKYDRENLRFLFLKPSHVSSDDITDLLTAAASILVSQGLILLEISGKLLTVKI